MSVQEGGGCCWERKECGQRGEKGEKEACIQACSCIITRVLRTAYCLSGVHVLRYFLAIKLYPSLNKQLSQNLLKKSIQYTSQQLTVDVLTFLIYHAALTIVDIDNIDNSDIDKMIDESLLHFLFWGECELHVITFTGMYAVCFSLFLKIMF